MADVSLAAQIMPAAIIRGWMGVDGKQLRVAAVAEQTISAGPSDEPPRVLAEFGGAAELAGNTKAWPRGSIAYRGAGRKVIAQEARPLFVAVVEQKLAR